MSVERSSNNILIDGETSSSYWPLETDQMNANKKPVATRRLTMIRISMTLNELELSPNVELDIMLDGDLPQSKT